MDLGKIFNFSVFTCGLIGLLLLMVFVLAFLRGRHKLGDRAGVLIIAAVLLVVTLALSVGNF